MDKNWYVLAVQPGKERYVEMQIKSAGYGVLCPRYKRRVRHARAVKTVTPPLFPGYVFVELESHAASWRSVNWIPGAIGFVRFEGNPSSVNSDFLENLKQYMATDGSSVIEKPLSIGDRVQAISGPFERVLGEVIDMSDGERVTVLMEALNRKIELTIARTAIVVAA